MAQRLILLFLFFASGLAALSYEIVWIRLLSLTLSITVYSLTTVLCAFMAGLGLGALIGSVMADRLRRPLLAFGTAEIGIAICGLIVPSVLSGLGPAYVWIHDLFGGEGVLFGTSRFALAFGVLLVPSTLMGVTLPLLSRAVIDRDDVVGRRAGALYSANTLGAVFGCIGTGFFLIPEIGLQATSTFAASLNVLVGIGALALASRFEVVTPSRATEGPVRIPLARSIRVAALAYGVSGFTAMGYEVLWTRALEHYTHNSTYAYTAMLGTFLAGLALGSAIAARFADRIRRPLLAVALAQIGVAVTVIAALRIYTQFETLVPAIAEGLGGLDDWGRVVMLMFSETWLTMGVMTLLLGAMFPLTVRVAVDSLDRVGRDVGLVYVANTIGSISGSLVVGFLLLPSIGMRGTFVFLIVINCAMGGGLLLIDRQRRGALPVAAAAAAVAAIGVMVLPSNLFESQFVARFGDLVFYREEVTDTVMVTENSDGERVIRYSDGRGTAGTISVIGDRMYGHLPLMLHPHPVEILQICFGVGNSLSSVLQHPVERVDAVELSPGVLLAAQYFTKTNRDSMNDPRVNMIINDGRNFMITGGRKYDVIRLDPPELHTRGVVNLYTKEFYELALSRLAPGGIFSIWINIVMTPEEEIRMILRTMGEVFPHVSVWHDPKLFSWIINGSVTPHDPDLALLGEKFADPRVREDLASIGIDDEYAFLRHFVFADGALLEWAGDGPLVVDDHTRLDFSVPRSQDAFFGMANFNTDYYLLRFMGKGGGNDLGNAGRIFLDKVARMQKVKRSVVPSLGHPDATGLTPGELAERIGPTGR